MQRTPIHPKEALELILINHRIRQPMMLLGPPGCAKSALFLQATQQLKIQFLDLRLIYFDPVDLRGIPMPDNENHTTKWLTPDFFPKDGEGILLMEELTSAPTSTQAAAYQLTHDRRLGEYVLPPGWSVMAAGNRQSDRAVANRMPSALVSRFNMQELEVSNRDFEEFAATTDRIIPEIIAFLRLRPECLMNFNPAKWTDNAPFACPRTWEYLSRAMIETKGRCPRSLMNGFVGEGPAAEFWAYLDIYRKIPSIEEILKNPRTARVPSDPAPLYAISTALARITEPKNAPAVFDYINRIPKEFEVLCVKDIAVRNKDMRTITPFNSWLAKNAEVFS